MKKFKCNIRTDIQQQNTPHFLIEKYSIDKNPEFVATIEFIHQFSLSNKKGNTLSHFSNMFKCKKTCKFMISLNCKIICFLRANLSVSAKSHKDSRHFRFQVAYVQVPLQKYPPDEHQPNPFLFFTLYVYFHICCKR